MIQFRANILIVLGSIIRLSVDNLIVSAHALIVLENYISFFARILIAFVHALIVLENRISFSTHTLILSAHTLIASTLPSDIAYSPTVPGGDTPCLTAGDARRANPWESNTSPSDAGGVAQQPQHLFLVFIFCCYIVTSSLLEYSHLKTYTLRA